MKKLLIISMLMSAALMSCGGGNHRQEPDALAVEAMEAVDAIYSHVFEVYNQYLDMEGIEDASYDSMLVFDERYLSSDYLALYRQVMAVDSLYASDGIGFFDYDHWIQGQDWDKLSFRIDTAWTVSPSEVHVKLTISNFGQITVELPMVKEADGWKIGDFITFGPGAGSELQAMKEYVDIEHESDPD